MSDHRFLCFVAVLLCFWSVNALSSEDKTAFRAALHPFVMHCVEEFGVTEEQFEEARDKGSVAGINPCFMSCFLKKAEFFDSNGMYDFDKAMTFAKAHFKSEEAVNIFQKLGTDCVKVNDEEVSDGEKGCDRAKLFMDCIVEHKENHFD